MNATDIIGYAYEGATYCSNCLTEEEKREASPMFADAESDYPLYCDKCEIFIPTSLTGDGEKYVIQAYADNPDPESTPASWLEEWDYLRPRAEAVRIKKLLIGLKFIPKQWLVYVIKYLYGTNDYEGVEKFIKALEYTMNCSDEALDIVLKNES